MKTKALLATFATVLLLSGTAFAFHGGGVAHCDGCHSMHNSADNEREGSTTAADLMKGTDASSTCLNCHEGAGGYHVNSALGSNMSAGGDFFWVSSEGAYGYSNWAGQQYVDPDNHGHNVIAANFGLTEDATNGTAPGGIMLSSDLGCTSCHDPHGQVDGGTSTLDTPPIAESGSYGAAVPIDGSILGNYRLLGDAGYKLIVADAPIARANGSSGTQVDYGTGMSAWCISCHTLYNDNSNKHPVNVNVPLAYDSYISTGNYKGVAATSYDSLVPFERNETVGANLDETSTVGVDGGNGQVMCLTCHRAHASAFDNAVRWDTGHEFLIDSGILNESGTTLLADGAIPYYRNGTKVDIAAEYGVYQRSLCNKCHVQD